MTVRYIHMYLCQINIFHINLTYTIYFKYEFNKILKKGMFEGEVTHGQLYTNCT